MVVFGACAFETWRCGSRWVETSSVISRNVKSGLAWNLRFTSFVSSFNHSHIPLGGHRLLLLVVADVPFLIFCSSTSSLKAFRSRRSLSSPVLDCLCATTKVLGIR